jgi:hypothetical protein
MTSTISEPGVCDGQQAPYQNKLIVKVRRFVLNGEQMVSVPLFGIHGEGTHMVLEESVWRAGRAAGWPAMFTMVAEPKVGKHYVVSCRKPLCEDGIAVHLSRVIMAAKRGEMVSFRDGNTRNLHRNNLLKESRQDLCYRVFGLPSVIEETEDIGDDLDVPW